MKSIEIYPNLVRIATTKEQYEMLESLERSVELTHKFLKTNKKADFEKGIDHLNYCLMEVDQLADNNMICDQDLIDVIHDVLLLPSYIFQYTAEKNETIKKIVE